MRLTNKLIKPLLMSALSGILLLGTFVAPKMGEIGVRYEDGRCIYWENPVEFAWVKLQESMNWEAARIPYYRLRLENLDEELKYEEEFRKMYVEELKKRKFLSK